MKLKFFDFEVFPHWWCCVFGDMLNDNAPEQIKNTFRVISSDDHNARDKLIKELTEHDCVDVGYNIKGYDLIIANAIYQGFAPEQVRIISDIIVNPSLAFVDKEHSMIQSFAKRRFNSCVYLDLFDSSDGTLKDKESSLGLSIRETTVPFDKEVLSEQDKEDIIFYCKHDVWSSMQWYLTIIEPFIKAKLTLTRHFNLPEEDAYKLTNTQLVANVLGAKRTTFSDSEEVNIILPNKIKDYVNNNLPTEIVEYVLHNKDTRDVSLFKNIVTFADGGIHSVLDTKPNRGEKDVLFVESDSEYTLINVDVSSYYPSIMIQLNTLSRAAAYKDRFKNIFEERLAIKHKANKTPQDKELEIAFKLVLNSTYGASGSKYCTLYDEYQRTRTCRFGQLLLAALANRLYQNINECSIIQLNTDGILCYLPRTELDKAIALKDEWCQITSMIMDIDNVEKIWQRDVNNYLMVQEGGKIKRKGGWLVDDYIKPGAMRIAPLDCYAVSKAAIKWLTQGIDPIKTLLANDCINDFVINCKKGPTFKGIIQRFTDGHVEELNKSNRVIAVKDTYYGPLFKYKLNHSTNTYSYTTVANVPDHAMIVNDDLSIYDMKELRKKIDYMYYIERLSDKFDYTFKQLAGSDLFITTIFDPISC